MKEKNIHLSTNKNSLKPTDIKKKILPAVVSEIETNINVNTWAERIFKNTHIDRGSVVLR